MAQRPKAKSKRKGRKGTNTDKDQSARFIETARQLGVDESGKHFERVVEKLLPRKSR